MLNFLDRGTENAAPQSPLPTPTIETLFQTFSFFPYCTMPSPHPPYRLKQPSFFLFHDTEEDHTTSYFSQLLLQWRGVEEGHDDMFKEKEQEMSGKSNRTTDIQTMSHGVMIN